MWVEKMKHDVIGPNIIYLDEMRRKLVEDTQIFIRYQWKCYLKRKAKAKKAAAKAKKEADAKALKDAKNKKPYGRK